MQPLLQPYSQVQCPPRGRCGWRRWLGVRAARCVRHSDRQQRRRPRCRLLTTGERTTSTSRRTPSTPDTFSTTLSRTATTSSSSRSWPAPAMRRTFSRTSPTSRSTRPVTLSRRRPRCRHLTTGERFLGRSRSNCEDGDQVEPLPVVGDEWRAWVNARVAALVHGDAPEWREDLDGEPALRGLPVGMQRVRLHRGAEALRQRLRAGDALQWHDRHGATQWMGRAAPEGVTADTPTSWLLCMMIVDALGWAALMPEATVPRPEHVSPDLTWPGLIHAVRFAMWELRTGPHWWAARMDMRLHWPTASRACATRGGRSTRPTLRSRRRRRPTARGCARRATRRRGSSPRRRRASGRSERRRSVSGGGSAPTDRGATWRRRRPAAAAVARGPRGPRRPPPRPARRRPRARAVGGARAQRARRRSWLRGAVRQL